MKINQYYEISKKLSDSIYKKIQYTAIRQEILKYSSGIENILFIDMICKIIEDAFLTKSSYIANKTSLIFQDLAYSADQQLTQRMSQKSFQQNLKYALRRRISKMGNRFTMHPILWSEIQGRILSVYQFWFEKYSNEQEKYHNILETYRNLKELKVWFPIPIEQQVVGGNDLISSDKVVSNKENEGGDRKEDEGQKKQDLQSYLA